MMARHGLWLMALALLPAGAPAVERSTSDGPVPAAAQRSHNSAVRPKQLFNMRGRRDPFVPLADWSPAGSLAFNITGLEFKGVIEVDGVKAALFISGDDRALYTLRGNRLYGSNQKPVAGVTGKLLDGKGATLRQGELSLAYSGKRAAKRKY